MCLDFKFTFFLLYFHVTTICVSFFYLYLHLALTKYYPILQQYRCSTQIFAIACKIKGRIVIWPHFGLTVCWKPRRRRIYLRHYDRNLAVDWRNLLGPRLTVSRVATTKFGFSPRKRGNPWCYIYFTRWELARTIYKVYRVLRWWKVKRLFQSAFRPVLFLRCDIWGDVQSCRN